MSERIKRSIRNLVTVKAALDVQSPMLLTSLALAIVTLRPLQPRLALTFWALNPQIATNAATRGEQERYRDAIAKGDWNAAIAASRDLIEAVQTPQENANWQGNWYELFLLAGRTDEVLDAAASYLKPLRYGGESIDTDSAWIAFLSLHENDHSRSFKDFVFAANSWMGNRAAALNSCVQAYLLEGKIGEADRCEREIEADYRAVPALCGTSAPQTEMDLRSQTIPLRFAAARATAHLRSLANEAYQSDPGLRIAADEQRRLMAVFASLDLGHLERSRGHRKQAVADFKHAIELMDRRKIVVNREILQWYIAHEQIQQLER